MRNSHRTIPIYHHRSFQFEEKPIKCTVEFVYPYLSFHLTNQTLTVLQAIGPQARGLNLYPHLTVRFPSRWKARRRAGEETTMGPRDCRVDIDGRDYCSVQLHRPNGKTPVLLPGMQPILWPPASLRACVRRPADSQLVPSLAPPPAAACVDPAQCV